ncbi:MAG TPA: CoA transferase [Burkholderiales bacterium]|nr:CoA transferase [Burkholderiales bacterium]
MMRPFEGVKILDCTHVLAGPFAAYQLAVLGADVIKVEDPNEPDQSRESGADMALNKKRMGTGFLTQGSNKRSIALNLKTEGGRDALKRLVRDWADVLVENYRPGLDPCRGRHSHAGTTVYIPALTNQPTCLARNSSVRSRAVFDAPALYEPR